MKPNTHLPRQPANANDISAGNRQAKTRPRSTLPPRPSTMPRRADIEANPANNSLHPAGKITR